MDIDSFKSSFHFSNETGQAYYAQLASYFEIQIQAGVLKPGDQMLAENDLCEALGISRTTVRLAMNQLSDKGLIIRQRGRGTFIAEKKVARPTNYLYNFTENIKQLGYTPHSSVILQEVTDVFPGSVHAALKLPAENMKAFHLVRIRYADQEALLVEDTYIPYYLCSGIETYDFSQNSLYQILTNNYHVETYHATETIEAVIINKKDAEALNCKSGIAGFKIKRISHTKSGFVYEFTTSISRADRCIFQLDLYQNGKTNANSFRQMTLYHF